MRNTITFNDAFEDIRNYLAGKTIGITRDKSLLNEVVKCLFCKTRLASQDLSEKSNEEIATIYRQIFTRLKAELSEIFDDTSEILLDPDSIAFIDKKLNHTDLEDPHDDPLSILYQTFIGSEIRGNEGQFFTPIAAVKWIVEAIEPKLGEKIIDPACGAGSFLSYAARYLKENGGKEKAISKNLFGIEKDEYLSKLAKTHLALATFNQSNIICGDSIERKIQNNGKIPFEIDNQFDIVLANPPFGAKIKIGTEETKKKFDLAHKWTKKRGSETFVKSDKVIDNPTPQILYLELCIRLLKPGGRMGIVVPESLITSLGNAYVVQYLREHVHINVVIGMPESLFKTSGKGGTHTKTCLLIATRLPSNPIKKGIFMAEAKWCGHDSRGNQIPYNDLPFILNEYKGKKRTKSSQSLGYWVSQDSISENILAPRYYNPEIESGFQKLSSSHELVVIGDLVDKGIIEITTGDEIGKLAYGTGEIPFVRTSDISNWEVKLDPKHGVSEDIYELYKKRQDVQEGDLLMVKDGTYLIGTCAYITKYDTRILYQSHLYKIRVLQKDKLSPFLLLAALSSNVVRSQIQSKRFTQDIIDTLGKRIYELTIPIPKDKKRRKEIENMVMTSINDRVESRELARKAKQMIVEI
jgi:type I restriction enzyme M protein